MDRTSFQLYLLGRAWLPCSHSLKVIIGVSFAWVVATRGGERISVRIILLALGFLVEGTADRVWFAHLNMSRDSGGQKARKNQCALHCDWGVSMPCISLKAL